MTILHTLRYTRAALALAALGVPRKLIPSEPLNSTGDGKMRVDHALDLAMSALVLFAGRPGIPRQFRTQYLTAAGTLAQLKKSSWSLPEEANYDFKH